MSQTVRARQAMRAMRREERRQLERQDRIETALEAIFLIFVLIAFIFAGTLDYQDDMAWRRAWAEQNGVTTND